MPYDKTPYSVIPKTPYSFVPISDRVFFPDWADRISQDVPFSDALSGSITFDIVAKTPVFVRNGQIAGGKDSSFSHMPDGTFFLPGTSIKGEIANVLRMMSFGKMGQVADKTFGLRDLSRSRAGESYKQKLRSVKCGWLRQTSNPASESGYELEDWGTPRRVSIKQISDFIYTGDPDLFTLVSNSRYANYFNDKKLQKGEVSHSSALHKYMRAEFDINVNPLEDGMFIWSASGTKNNEVQICTALDAEGYTVPDLSKGNPGVVVFTGQPSQSKRKEFFFMKPTGTPAPIFPSNKVIQAFFSINAASDDFTKFRKVQLDKGFSIPVFFLMEAGALHSIGLTSMFKYPYKKTIWDAIPAGHKKNDWDLSECMFGTIKGTSCKGRVQFGHAKAMGHPEPWGEKVFRMSQPRASFYPFYVENGTSWDDAVKISGHKRYPIRFGRPLPSPQGTKDMESSAAMLPPGTTFKETVRFHNLRPVELGALLSAITFHGNQDQCFHNIGFGKPLGYGAVSIQNIALEGVDVQDNPVGGINEYLAAFEDQMTAFTSNWLSSPQMSELLLMAQGIPEGKESSFEYMQLKDFLDAKDHRTSLGPFSSRIGKAGYSVPSVKK